MMMVEVQTCPSLEDIAAFLDGRVSAAERARLIRHLADCPTCLEVFAGAAQFLAFEEAAAGAAPEAAPDAARQAPATPAATPPRKAPLLPFRRPGWARPDREEAPRWGRRLGFGLAAAAVVTTIGVPAALLWPRLVLGPVATSAQLVAPLMHYPEAKPAKALLAGTYKEQVFRGASPSAPVLADLAQELMLGVDLVDLRIALEADDRRASADKAGNILTRMGDLVPPEVSGFYREVRQLETNNEAPSSLLTRANAAERSLVEEKIYPDLPLGRWIEAARLAALNGNRDFFQGFWRRHAHLSLLDDALDSKDAPLDPDTRKVLEDARRRIAAGSPADLDALAQELGQLVRSTDRKSHPQD